MKKLKKLLEEFFYAGIDYNEPCYDSNLKGVESYLESELFDKKQSEITEAIEELFEKPLYLHRVYNDNGSKVLLTSSSEFPSKEFGLSESGIGTVFQHDCKQLIPNGLS